jgi:hypothetical protein
MRTLRAVTQNILAGLAKSARPVFMAGLTLHRLGLVGVRALSNRRLVCNR